MKKKKRYLVVSIDFSEKLGEENARRLATQAVFETLGELGAA